MKYIKKFNESLSEVKSQYKLKKAEFIENCEPYLAELYDMGMVVDISCSGPILLVIQNDGELFSWSEVKEQVITLLDYLQNKYKLYLISICDEYEDEEGVEYRYVTFEDMSDPDFNSSEISYIEITFE